MNSIKTKIRVDPLQEKTKVSVRILLAAFWVCHFLLWSFGDMMAILQGTAEPITETVILVIAPILAITQTSMVAYSLSGEPKYVRWLNIVVPLIFLLFNLQYLAESSAIWNYILGSEYIVLNLSTIWNAWKWQQKETSDDSMNNGRD